MTSDTLAIICGCTGLAALGLFFVLWVMYALFQCERCWRISFVEHDNSHAGINICRFGWGCKK